MSVGEGLLPVEPGSILSGALGPRGWKAEASTSWLWLLCLAKLPGFAQDSVARLTQHPKEESLNSTSFLATAGRRDQGSSLCPRGLGAW